MILPQWHEEPLAKHHNKAAFDCGDEALNRFLKHFAHQNHEKGGSKTFLALDNQIILGFYSVSPASITYERAPDAVKRGLARHEIPVFRLSRLAVDRFVQGLGLGGQLLLSAGCRCLTVSLQAGGIALLIDAKSERAAQWYASYGAVPLKDTPLSLVLPFKTIYIALKAAERI